MKRRGSSEIGEGTGEIESHWLVSVRGAGRSVEPTTLYGIHRHLARFARSRAAFGQAALISLFIAEAFDLPIGHYSPRERHR